MWVLIVSFFISFVFSLVLTRLIIPFFKGNRIVAFDLQKKTKPLVANSGGMPVFFGMFMGLMFFIAIQVFIFDIQSELVFLFAAILTIFLITLIGFFDDLNARDVVEGKRDIRKGLKQWQKPLLTFPAAIPLMAIKAGYTSMTIPLIGSVNFGLLYPLIIVPLGVVCAANAINLLGGFNGSEAGMGIVYCSTLGIYSLINGQIVSAVIFLSCVGSLLGFLKYNWVPAKILSGDSIQYLMGSVVASGVIIGNMEKAGLFLMTPFIIEFFLKLRGKLKVQCMGKLRKDGKLDSPYGEKIYSWTHIIMNIKPMTEKQVTISLILMQIIFSLLFVLVLGIL
jgi:UDP-N-acetylglucosamine--dolichyl-phosphate N-acetylglucosaminephosphotransferase